LARHFRHTALPHKVGAGYADFVMKRTLFALLCLPLFVFAVAACGGDETDISDLATAAADVPPSASLQLTARALKFDKDTLVAPAGQQVTVTLDNQDGGTVHNIAIYTAEDAKELIYRGDLFQGRESRDFSFQAPPAGVYYFRCDAHPEMDGAFITK
jgi:plastocyanin